MREVERRQGIFTGWTRHCHGRTPVARGWTVLEVLIVLVLVAALLAILLPNLHAARIRNNEAAAIQGLRALHRAEQVVRAAALVDEDDDGRGEHAFLPELSGERNPRTYVPASGRHGGAPAPLPQLYLRTGDDGVAKISGYRLALYLPARAADGDGPPDVPVVAQAGDGGLRGPDGAAVTGVEVDPALAVDTWCAYAWPVRREGDVPAATGRRTFFVNQSGYVLTVDDVYSQVGPADAPGMRPEPGAAFQPPGPASSITGAAAVGTIGRDGHLWRVVE